MVDFGFRADEGSKSLLQTKCFNNNFGAFKVNVRSRNRVCVRIHVHVQMITYICTGVCVFCRAFILDINLFACQLLKLCIEAVGR